MRRAGGKEKRAFYTAQGAQIIKKLVSTFDQGPDEILVPFSNAAINSRCPSQSFIQLLAE